jgi:hypothetical protein
MTRTARHGLTQLVLVLSMISLTVAGCGRVAGPASARQARLPGQAGFPARLGPGGAVPWVNAPAVSADFEPPTAPIPPATGPACRQAQLSAVLSRWIPKVVPGEQADPVESASLYGYVTVTNVSAAPCTLQGTPAVLLTPASSGSAPIAAADLGGNDSPPVGLPPQGAVNFRLDWDAPYCGGPGPFAMRATLHGVTLHVAVNDQATPRCVHDSLHPDVQGGLAASAVTPGSGQRAAPLVSRLQYLRAAASEVPAEVRPRQVVHFVIALTNPSRSPISLAGRVGYDLEVFCLGTHGRSGINYDLDYLLDNRPVPVIAAHATVRFAMVLRLGPQPFPGPALDVTWKLLAADNLGGRQPAAFFRARATR